MNKVEFIDTYKTFLLAVGQPANQVRVGAGGACLMYDIRQETSDLDLELPESLFVDIVESYGLTIERTDGFFLAKWNSSIDLHPVKGKLVGVMIEDVFVTTVADTLVLKRKLNREKDQVDIVALENLL